MVTARGAKVELTQQLQPLAPVSFMHLSTMDLKLFMAAKHRLT